MILIGTSGYNYPEWKGSFYPADLAAAKMLPYYAARFSTVEINYTFYRMPTEKILAGWTAQVPPEFRFTLKAPRRITHDAKLVGCEDLTGGVLPRGRHARQPAGRAAVSASADAEEGRGAPRRLPGVAAAEGARPRSNSAMRRGSTTRSTSGCARTARRCAWPTAKSWRRRSK